LAKKTKSEPVNGTATKYQQTKEDYWQQKLWQFKVTLEMLASTN